MYFVVSIHFHLNDFVESGKLTTISSVRYFFLTYKDIEITGYKFYFFQDDGWPLRCHEHYNDKVSNAYQKHESPYLKFRSVASSLYYFRKYRNVAKSWDLPF